jgi:predicted permease
MSKLSGFFRKLGILLGRNRFRSELDEEMAFHRAEAEKRFVAEGMSASDAHLAAKRQFGNAVLLKEQSHEEIGFLMENVWQDLRYAQRQLRKNAGFTVTAIAVLALGIGASVAIFGFVDAALIKPLPYADPSRLVMLYEANNLGPRFHLSYPDYIDWKQQSSSFTSMDIFSAGGFMLKTPDGPQRVDGASVTTGFFRTLGVAPALGRDFAENEPARSAPATALLSYGAWQRRYGGRQDILGQSVVLNGGTVTIIGVLPRTFAFAPAEPVDYWITDNGASQCALNRSCHDYFGIARLKDGVTFAIASADVKAVQQRLEKAYPDASRDRTAFMLPLDEVVLGDIRPVFLVLMGGAALLLLIAIINTANLLLVRTESRRREVAVRGALGASAARLMRQFVTEALLLAAAGTGLGTVAGTALMSLLSRLLSENTLATMPYLREIGFNLHVAVFAVALFPILTLIFALTPILRLSFSGLRDGLAEGSRGSAGTLWRRFGANLVVIEITVAMVLLVGAGLLTKSLYRLMNSDTGLASDHLALIQVSAVGNTYQKSTEQVQLAEQVSQQIAALPGVRSVGITSQLPFGDGDGAAGFHRLDLPDPRVMQEVTRRYVSSGYLPTLQARMLRGRSFPSNQDPTQPAVAIVNVTLVRQYFRDADPVGKRFVWDGSKTPVEIIGIVNDVQEGQLDAAPRAVVYAPFVQGPDNEFAVTVRTTQSEEALLAQMTAAVNRIDPGLAVVNPTTMRKRVLDSPSAYLHRATASLVGGFAAVALLLTVVGLYGVVSYSVNQRTREIGVRMALGAPRSSVYRMILKEAASLTAIGVFLGLLCSTGAATFLRNLLFGTQPWDAATLAIVAVVLAASALIASFIPARRAAGVNPVEALRAE